MHDRTANLLGAASLAVTDLLLGATTAAAATGPSGTAALVVLSRAPGLSATELGRRVGLTQSAATRMVDALESRGLVERRKSVGKWVAVHPTEQGLRAAESVLTSREDRVAGLLSTLDDGERAALTSLLEKLLVAAYRENPDEFQLCRLCDRDSCGDGRTTHCPVGAADLEARAYGPRE
ncbi:MarR family winged helix-turn-helix transcriptional regulator [Promicromonospora panici]|uniref:MarR family winged helix-turn-helix transcriptional regulator n=1 Tax=Promicromonospora panici TaxID=2219658 RepID=UPI00101C2EDD|nr:MarR family transcriptional regulator [Promicromonospora panici]